MCDHPKRNEIDRGLVDRSQPLRYFAKRYGLSIDAVYRHFGDHLPATLAKASGAKAIARGDALLEKLQELQNAAAVHPREGAAGRGAQDGPGRHP